MTTHEVLDHALDALAGGNALGARCRHLGWWITLPLALACNDVSDEEWARIQRSRTDFERRAEIAHLGCSDRSFRSAIECDGLRRDQPVRYICGATGCAWILPRNPE